MQFNEEASGFEPTIPVVFTRADGDVEVAWMRGPERAQVRRFRSHLGHVVEVLGEGDRLRRTGPGLRGAGSLRVDAELPVVVERALAALAEAVPHGPPLTAAAPGTISEASASVEPSMTGRLHRWLGSWLRPQAIDKQSRLRSSTKSSGNSQLAG